MKKNDKFFFLFIGLIIVFYGTVKLTTNIMESNQKKDLIKIADEMIDDALEKYNSELEKNPDLIQLVYKYSDWDEIATQNDSLNYEGKKPRGGVIYVRNDGIGIALYNDYYCAYKDYADDEVKIIMEFASECDFGTEYYTDKTGANKPEVSGNLVPVLYKNNKWLKADLYQEWYDYDKKEWANAVLIKYNKRAEYIFAASGKEIKPEDILAYLVWIPRYSYKLFNTNGLDIDEQQIEINFEENRNSTDNELENGQLLTHPAFSFDDEELNGFWIAKFETNGEAENTSIVPNSEPLTNLDLSDQFELAHNFNDLDDYGLVKVNNAHIIRNIDWGAVAYLSQSKYGNLDHSGVKRNTYLSGCVTVDENNNCTEPYNSTNGVKLSTTGNVYGVYDMNNSYSEVVMAYTKADEGSDLSLFDKFPESEYYDEYEKSKTFNDNDSYKRRILGDALSETRTWYNGTALMLYDKEPWLIRGSNGIFSFKYYDGSESDDISFRIVIT